MRFRSKANEQEELQPVSDFGFRGNCFTVNMPSDWKDQTAYILAGPVEDQIQHNIVINVEYDVEIGSVAELADRQIQSLESQLQGCRILKRGEITLNNGQEAYEVIFRWEPTNVNRFYQKQIYVLYETTAYTLSTTFTKKTRRTRGPEVDRVLMTFNPEQLPDQRN